jgi:hypothetical protein
MPQGSRGLWRALDRLRIAPAGRVTYRTPPPFPHCWNAGSQQVENFVDNRPRQPSRASPGVRPASAAQKTGMKKAFNINSLSSALAAKPRGVVCNANAGAAVELSARTVGRSSDG